MISSHCCNNSVISCCPVKSLSNRFNIYRKTVQLVEAKAADWLCPSLWSSRPALPHGVFFAHWILRASGKLFRRDGAAVPVDNKMIIYCFFNICLVSEAWLADACTIWNAPSSHFGGTAWGGSLGIALCWKAQVWGKYAMAVTFPLTKECRFIIVAQRTIIMPNWCLRLFL